MPSGAVAPKDTTAVDGVVTLRDIEEAAQRIQDLVMTTPIVQLPHPDRVQEVLHCKAESLQPTGAFKLRGAYNAIAQQLPEARERGVVAQSSGNHGRAVAWIAKRLGLRAVVVMPDAAPPTKIEAIRALGAAVELVPAVERDIRPREIVASEGLVYVPPYDDPRVIAGQGTIGLELICQLPEVDVLLVPVSGGGLIAGVATAVKAMRPETAVIGVEPELAADAAQSLREGTADRVGSPADLPNRGGWTAHEHAGRPSLGTHTALRRRHHHGARGPHPHRHEASRPLRTSRGGTSRRRCRGGVAPRSCAEGNDGRGHRLWRLRGPCSSRLGADGGGGVVKNHPHSMVDPHPYSDAMVASGLVFVSGSLPLREDGSVVGGRREALDEAMATARRRLGTVGARLEEAVKVTYFVTDISLRDEANEQFSHLWPAPRPARTLVEVSGLPYGAVVEIDIVGRAG